MKINRALDLMVELFLLDGNIKPIENILAVDDIYNYVEKEPSQAEEQYFKSSALSFSVGKKLKKNKVENSV